MGDADVRDALTVGQLGARAWRADDARAAMSELRHGALDARGRRRAISLEFGTTMKSADAYCGSHIGMGIAAALDDAALR